MKAFLFFLSLNWIVIVGAVFVSIQKNHEEKIRSSLHSQLKQDLVVSNFELVTRSINDLTKREVVSCAKVLLSKENPILILDHSYKDNCDRSFFRLAKSKKFMLSSTGKTDFMFQMIIESPAGLELSMWLVLSLGLILVFLTQKIFVFNFATREKVMVLEKAHAEELNKISKQVAHDIRSPLMALKTIAFVTKFPSDESKNLFNQGLKRINDIADDLLKLGQGKIIENTSVSNIKNIVEQVLEEKRLMLKGKNLELKLIAEGAQSPSVLADKDLSRVLSNLINNAYDAIDDNAKITVKLLEEGGLQKIMITDNGRGFTEQAKRKSSSSETGSGTGLGLKHAREIVENHGGNLEIISSITGSTVSLSLPLERSIQKHGLAPF